ncbi:MAG: gliding motility-associated C-terminal domain-containing protein [Bacteroidia bacterium]
MKFFYLNLLNFFFPKVAARNIFSALCVFFLFFSFTAESSVIKKFNSSNKKFAAPPVLTLGASDFNGFNISCNGDSDGSIDLTITGGLPPFDVLWSNGEVTEDIDTLTAGNYSVRVIDANSDTVFSNIDLIQPDPIGITIDSIANILCFGGNNGFIGISITGGVQAYLYLWSDASTVQDLQNVISGTYTVTVTDANSCTATVSGTITQPAAALSATTSSTNSTCGTANGTATATPAGGTVPYSYLWSNGQTTQTATALAAATYTVTVTDDNGCTTSASQIVSNTNGPIAVLDSIHNENCFGESTGDIFITATGGTGTLTYLWSNATTIQDLQNVISGTYTVTVTDDNSCTATVSGTITQPAVALSTTISPTNSTCGTANGTATATPAGGTSPYSYLWSNGQTTQTATALAAATYSVTVTDANICSRTDSATVIDLPPPVITATAINYVSCYGDSNGYINVTTSSGTPPFSYLWSNGVTTEDLINVPARNYTVTVTDVNLCSASISDSIHQPDSITLTLIIVPSTGLPDGSIETFVMGGTMPYSFSWSNGSTTSLIDSLLPGSYSLTLTDSHACVIDTTAIVAGICSINVDSITPVTCFGGNDGAIDISVIGVVLPVVYIWSNSATTQDISGLTANTYTVTATDNLLCSATVSIQVPEPTQLNDSLTITNATCGQSNGTATVYGYDATGPYTYLWSNGFTTQLISSLAANTYTVTITDAHGCTKIDNAFVGNTNGPVVAIDSIKNVSCFGDSTGAIYIDVTGGSLPYGYLWSNSQTTQDIDTIPAGPYSVIVTDNNSCSVIASTNVLQNALLQVDSIVTTPSTCNGSNGTATVYASGGVLSYSYSWSSGGSNQTIVSLFPGTYTVTVTDNVGCQAIGIDSVISPGNPTAQVDSLKNVSCFGANDGAIYISVVGGTGPYTYVWTPGGSTGQDTTGLSPQNYTVIIFDANLCNSQTVFTITQPATSLNDSIHVINESCGYGNGSLTVYPLGGTPQYTFLWSTGKTSQTIDSLIAGTYTVTVSDSNSCTKTSSATVINITAPVIQLDSIVNVKCNGQSNGAIYISISGGTAPFHYLWTPGAFTTQDDTGLVAGNYSVIVTDTNNCSDTSAIFPVTEPLILYDSIQFTAATCNGPTGSATVFPYGGSPLFTYLWSNSVTTQTISNVFAATYTVTVTDSKNCFITDTVIIPNIGVPVIIVDSVKNIKCFGDSIGAIYITVTSGVLPYSYQWSNSDTIQDGLNLIAGIYTVIVTDGNNCTASVTDTIHQPLAPLNDSISVVNAHCNHADGSLTAFPFGGTGSQYSYQWSIPSTAQSITNLFAGIYTVTVTDGNGCTIISTDSVVNEPPPSINVDSIHNLKCNGNNIGAIFISVAGGTPGYGYLWSNGFTSQDISNLLAGTYTITVSDANLCLSIDTITISQPAALLDSIVITDATCSGSNGAAIVYPYGGVSPYTYLWYNGQTTQSISGLIAGSYTVTITDFNSCTYIDNANVSNVGGPNVIIDSVKNVSCQGAGDGAIYVTPTGGLQPYTYFWSPGGAAGQDTINLDGGTYTLTVTDAANCIDVISQVINEPASLVLTPGATSSNCNASTGTATVSAIGGTLPYTYLWSNAQTTQTISGISAGTYTVTVTDSHGCKEDTVTIVINPNGPAISGVVITNVKCFGDLTGSINITVNNGTLPYSYLWSNTFPTVTSQDLINVGAGLYSVTVTDAFNCTVTQNYTITQPPDIVISFFITPPSCNSSNGSVIATVTGGTGSLTYTYSWNTGQTTNSLSNLPAGSYTFTVTDANLCKDSSIANLSNISAPVITVIDSGMVSCFGVNDGFISVSVSGGSPPYVYSWSNTLQTGPLISNLPGLPTGLDYTLTITDSDNCVSVRTVKIFEPLPLNIPASIPLQNGIYNIKCHGGSDGSITIIPSGGTSPYTYLWSYNANQSQNLTNIPAGIYTVTVTDAHGCTKDSIFALTEPPELISNAGSDYVICGETADTLHGNTPAYGTGHWIVAGGNGTVLFPYSPVTPVTNLSVDNNNIFQWIVSDDSCSVLSQIIIRVNSAITAIAGADRIVCNDSVVLTAVPPQFGSGFWAIINGGSILVDSSVAQTAVISLSPGVNQFLWTVMNGTCIDSAVVTITLRDPSDCLEAIQMPTGITPNGDGKNDVFYVQGLGDYYQNSILIYNRWGNKVFEQSPYQNNWEGTNQSGDLLPEGTYFVILKIKEITKVFTGYIDLRR